MAAATLGGIRGFGSALYSQTQTLQAQRAVDQAEANARALRQRSTEAQGAAARAEANARSLKAQADRADSDARTAQQQLTSLQSSRSSAQRLGEVYGRAAAGVAVTDIGASAVTGAVVDTTA